VSAPRILVADGNVAAMRERQKAAVGYDSANGYARVLRRIQPDLLSDVAYPADGNAALPVGAALADYDGVAMTGSALNVYHATPEVTRQIDFARSVFAAGVPFFGSCWGLQIAVTAAGGKVGPNPLGREFGFARRICLTDAGASHALFGGKPTVFEAPTVHRDTIESLPTGAETLANNDMGLQAAVFAFDRGTFWGLQYHPEYDYLDLAAAAERYGSTLIDEGLFKDKAALDGYVADLRGLNSNPQDRALLWKHGLGAAMQKESLKFTELRNWIETQVLSHFRRAK
jgi:GMP synthase (glutamine-hydrolysing)